MVLHCGYRQLPGNFRQPRPSCSRFNCPCFIPCNCSASLHHFKRSPYECVANQRSSAKSQVLGDSSDSNACTKFAKRFNGQNARAISACTLQLTWQCRKDFRPEGHEEGGTTSTHPLGPDNVDMLSDAPLEARQVKPFKPSASPGQRTPVLTPP